jgi:hypothetical protein
MGKGRKVCKVFAGKPKGKKPLGRPRRRPEDGIKTDLKRLAGSVWRGFTWLMIGSDVGLL